MTVDGQNKGWKASDAMAQSWDASPWKGGTRGLANDYGARQGKEMMHHHGRVQ